MTQSGSDKDKANAIGDFFHNLWKQLKAINRDTLVYILLAVGLVLLLVQPLLGGAIIGIVAGWIFSDELTSRAIQVKEAIEREEVTRGVVLGVVLLAFFIEAPTLILGAAAALGVKRLLNAETTHKPKSGKSDH